MLRTDWFRLMLYARKCDRHQALKYSNEAYKVVKGQEGMPAATANVKLVLIC